MVTESTGRVLDALGDGTRRHIVELLGSGPRSVRQLADDLPVSRPAVSKHLRILKEARLVTDHAIGTQRFYELELDALGRVHSWIESFWDGALARFKQTAERTAPRRGTR